MGRHVDLDAARTARAEAAGEQPSVTLGGREFKLLPELPWDAAQAWRENRAGDFVSLVLANPEEAEDFLAERPSWRDLDGIIDALKVGEPGESEDS